MIVGAEARVDDKAAVVDERIRIDRPEEASVELTRGAADEQRARQRGDVRWRVGRRARLLEQRGGERLVDIRLEANEAKVAADCDAELLQLRRHQLADLRVAEGVGGRAGGEDEHELLGRHAAAISAASAAYASTPAPQTTAAPRAAASAPSR